MRASYRAIAPIGIIFYFPTYVLSQACVATSQNPYCDPSFANLICCPSPNICYWADRQGTPACCAQGQVCGVGGGVFITPQPATITATDGTQPTATTTLVGGVVGTVTSGAVGFFSTVTSGAVGVFSTVTSGAVGVFSTVTSGAVGVFSTATSAVGGAFATVSGVLVGDGAPRADIQVSMLILPLILTFWALAGAAGFYYR